MKCGGIAPGGHKAEDDPRIRDIRDAATKCAAVMHQARLSTHETSGIVEETHDTRKNRDEETSSVTGKKRTKRTKAGHTDVQIVTIYSITYKPTGLCVYTGKTKDPEHRLSGHASRGSKCRLIRNAIRKHGIKSFSLDPILRCRAVDADANESHWIIKNNTLYPAGYNLRHGSMAGEDTSSAAVVPVCMGVVPFAAASDEAAAFAEAWEDVSCMLEGVEEAPTGASELCKDLLRKVHPDLHGGEGRTYAATEVAAMLNLIRDAQ
jgi:hypothetical protein